MKEYVLVVEYTTGIMSMIVTTPNLKEAINQFEEELNKDVFFKDKGCHIPTIISAKLVPLLYRSNLSKPQ